MSNAEFEHDRAQENLKKLRDVLQSQSSHKVRPEKHPWDDANGDRRQTVDEWIRYYEATDPITLGSRNMYLHDDAMFLKLALVTSIQRAEAAELMASRILQGMAPQPVIQAHPRRIHLDEIRKKATLAFWLAILFTDVFLIVDWSVKILTLQGWM